MVKLLLTDGLEGITEKEHLELTKTVNEILIAVEPVKEKETGEDPVEEPCTC